MLDLTPRSSAVVCVVPTGPQAGNHAAYYISQDAGGITVMDQWAGPGKPTISSRYIRSKGKDKSGNFVSPSDNADAFSVIEH